MNSWSRFLLPALFAALLATPLRAQDKAPAKPKDVSLAAALPTGAFVFAETNGLAELITAIRDSEMVETVLESEQYKEFQKTEKFEDTDSGRQLAEFVLRMDLWEAGEKLLGARMGAALYPKKDSEEPNVVILLRPDPEAWSKQRIWTDPLLGLTAKRLERFRWGFGLKVYKLKGDKPFFMALHQEWVAFSNEPKLLEKTIALQFEDPKDHKRMKLKKAIALEKDAQFKSMAAKVGEAHLMRAYVDTKAISKAVGGRLGLPKKLDNPLGSFLVGGILELAATSNFASVTLDTDENGFVLEAGLDGDPKKLDERFQVFFSNHPKTGTTPIPEVPGLIGGFTMYRDIATWYRSRDALLQDEVLPEFDKFEAGVGNLLPGKDIGEDVLPLLGDNITFVSALQDYDHVKGEPGVKLPGFAFVIELDQVDEASDIFQLFFQTLLSVLNFEAGNQNRQPWLIETEMHRDVKITKARYLEKPEGDSLPIVFNFLPASARVGNKYIVSSSLGLCRNLIDAIEKPGQSVRHNKNHDFGVRLEPLAKILEMNTEHFEAQRVGEGRTAGEAKADVALFLTLLRGMNSLSFSTSATADGLKLQVKGNVN